MPNAESANWITWALKALADVQEEYKRYEDYYIGNHDLEFATDKWVATFGTEFEEFSDNWCQVVVDSLVQRMEITGWTTDAGDEAIIKRAEEIWDRNELAVDELDLYTQTTVKGDGFLIVWRDEEGADIYFNDALEVQVSYDPADKRKVTRAAKKFDDDKGQTYIYLYFPDRIERWYVPSGATADQIAATMAGMASPANLPGGWVQSGPTIANPTGIVPVFHFKNRLMGATNGLSELKAVIPMQNATNKLLMDLMVASEFGSFRQKYVAGGGQPKDGWRVGGDRVWATTDPNAKFGEFGQVDLEPIFKAVEVVVGHIAKITQTPMHYLRSSGDMPSGEALKTAESGLVKKCLARQKQWGAAWSRAMTFAIQLETGEKPESPVYPVWRDPETRHDLEQAQTAQLKSILGIPLSQLWAEHFDYTQEQILEFEKKNKAIAASVLADVVAQVGQAPPGTEQVTATPQQLMELLGQARTTPDGSGGLDISQVLALLPKSVTAQTTAGEATTKPQPNSRPPGSPTRRSVGFKD